MHPTNSNTSGIDCVISWVDGYDPIYQQRLKNFCEAHQLEQHQVVPPTRIQQCNEIAYCLQSIQRYAPWINKIYIITAQQIPEIVQHLQGTEFGQKIVMVDQSDLLQGLGIHTPVFNSISVEWLIWRIPGLSSQFLYLNDDFFLMRPIKASDFFQGNKLVLRGEWKTQSEKQFGHYFKQRIKGPIDPHRTWQEKAAQMAGFTKQFYLLPHAPFPLLKSTYEDWVQDHFETMLESVRRPFRDSAQISSIPLMVHLDIQAGRTIEAQDHQAIMVNGGFHSLRKIQKRLKKVETTQDISFVCMQSIDQASSQLRKDLLNWLEERMVHEDHY